MHAYINYTYINVQTYIYRQTYRHIDTHTIYKHIHTSTDTYAYKYTDKYTYKYTCEYTNKHT